jgi:hypothetical protein
MTSSAVSSRTVAAATGVRSNRGIGAIGEGGAAGEWENGIVTDHRVLAARQCQRVVETERGGGQCPRESTWVGSLHAGRQIYLVETCEQHMSGLIDAAPLEDESNDATS